MLLMTRIVHDSAERDASFTGCEGTKTKLNSSTDRAGNLDLGDGKHNDAPGVNHLRQAPQS